MDFKTCTTCRLQKMLNEFNHGLTNRHLKQVENTIFNNVKD